MKRILSIVLVLIMVAALLPAAAFADSTVAGGTFTKNEAFSWKLDKNYTLTVSGEGEMPYECPWFDYRSDIKAIVLEEGITMALDFEGLSAVTSVSLPDSLTSIAYRAFFGCSSLKSIKIPDGVEHIAQAAFGECKALATIKLPAGLTTMSAHCFSGCTSLKSFNVPSKITEISPYCFSNCSKLQTVGLPAGITKIWMKAFDGCTALSKIYYAGSKAQWNKITIEAGGDFGNAPLTKATKLYNSSLPSITVTAGNNSTSGKVTLKWNAVSGAEKYELYRATSKDGTYKKLTTTTKCSFTNTSTTAGSTYYYKVKALDKNGKVIITSDVVSRACKCAKPVVKASNDAKTGKVKLTWTAVDGASKYEVYRATAKDGSYAKMLSTSSTAYTNTSAKVNETYYYKVKAIPAKNADTCSATCAAVSATCKCAQPVVTLSNNAETGKIIIKWKAIDGAAKYEIYRATSKDGSYKKLSTTTKCSFTNTSTTAGNTYYYKVKAISAVNSEANSAYSAVVSRVCDCAKMTVKAKLTSVGGYTFSWDKVSGATSYKIYKASSENGSYKLLTETSSTSYTDNAVTAGHEYFYKFIAVSSRSKEANSAAEKGSIIASPAQPKNVKISNTDITKVKLSWSKAAGADGYLILIGTSSKVDDMEVLKDTTGTSASFNTFSLGGPGSKYYFAVVAYTNYGDDSILISKPSSSVHN